MGSEDVVEVECGEDVGPEVVCPRVVWGEDVVLRMVCEDAVPNVV